jgi:hypothetical protein
MKLTNFLDYIKNIGTKDVFRVLEDLGASLEAWAKQLGFDAWIMFLAALAATVLVGFFGYKMIKVLMGLGLAYVGYFVGVEIFTVAKETLTWLPGWSVYILGALIGILFMSLAVAKFSYATYTAFAIVGYALTLFYTDNAVLAVGGAVILAILSVSLLRVVFILTSSVACGMLSISFLSRLLPKLEFLKLGEGQWIALGAALVLALIFILVQFALSQKPSEELE